MRVYYGIYNVQKYKVKSEERALSTEKSGTLPCVNWEWIKHKVDIIESGNFYSVKCVGIMYKVGFYYVQSGILLCTKLDFIMYKVGFYYVQSWILLCTKWDSIMYKVGFY